MNDQTPSERHEDARRDLWATVAVNVASLSNCQNFAVPAVWADKVLADFDGRFPAPELAGPDE